jgi:hypothetical protein
MKWQMEKLGFKPLDSIKVAHKAKHTGQVFSIYLMWMPAIENAKPPRWSKQKFLEGIPFCIANRSIILLHGKETYLKPNDSDT